MTTALEHLAQRHKDVGNDYKEPDGTRYYCYSLAKELAEKLIREGKFPEVWGFKLVEEEDGVVLRKNLIPLPFERRNVRFGDHDACVCDGMVYDPLLSSPIPLEEYARKAFGVESLNRKPTLSKEDLLDMFGHE